MQKELSSLQINFLLPDKNDFVINPINQSPRNKHNILIESFDNKKQNFIANYKINSNSQYGLYESSDVNLMSFKKQTDYKNSLQQIQLSPNFKVYESINQQKYFLTDDQSNPQDLHNNQEKEKFNQSQNKNKNKQFQQNEMVMLLKNCKISIVSLQQEVDQKNKEIRQLKNRINCLETKLKQSQKQVQRTHQILTIYMKQSQKQDNQSEIQSQNNKDIQYSVQYNKLIKFQQQMSEQQLKHQNQFLKLQTKYQQIKKQIEKQLRLNFQLKSENINLKEEISKLKEQNFKLNQKITKVGQGVGKAILTIKKSKAEKIVNKFNYLISSEGKQQKGENSFGKIVNKKMLKQKVENRKIQNLSLQQFNFQTPAKVFKTVESYSKQKNIQSTAVSAQFYEDRLTNISIQLKRTQQVDRIQEMLNKMKNLAEQNNLSD